MSVSQRISEVLSGFNRLIEKNQHVFFTREWFQSHLLHIAFFVMATWCYIALRYECESAIVRNNRLQTELNEARYEAIARWGELTGKNKPEVIRNKVSSARVKLNPTDEPPIRVK